MTDRFVLSCVERGTDASSARRVLVRRSLVGLAAACSTALALGGCAQPSAEPARASLAGAPVNERSTPDPANPQIDPGPTDSSTPAGAEPWDAEATRACGSLVPSGFEQVAQSPDDAGTSTFWTQGRRWVACDAAAGAGVEPTIIFSPRKETPSGFDARSLAVTKSELQGADGEPTAIRLFAGGRLPWRLEELSYAFPDGHTEQARFVSSPSNPDEVWWSVTYTPTEGPLADPNGVDTELGAVTISIVGATAEAFRLPWKDLQRSE